MHVCSGSRCRVEMALGILTSFYGSTCAASERGRRYRLAPAADPEPHSASTCTGSMHSEMKAMAGSVVYLMIQAPHPWKYASEVATGCTALIMAVHQHHRSSRESPNRLGLTYAKIHVPYVARASIMITHAGVE